MSNFTGTEWICEKNGNGDFFIDSSRGESIGILYNDVPEVEANARLIAAAPEMYEWLKTITKIFEGGNVINVKGIQELLKRIDGKNEN